MVRFSEMFVEEFRFGGQEIEMALSSRSQATSRNSPGGKRHSSSIIAVDRSRRHSNQREAQRRSRRGRVDVLLRRATGVSPRGRGSPLVSHVHGAACLPGGVQAPTITTSYSIASLGIWQLYQTFYFWIVLSLFSSSRNCGNASNKSASKP